MSIYLKVAESFEKGGGEGIQNALHYYEKCLKVQQIKQHIYYTSLKQLNQTIIRIDFY